MCGWLCSEFTLVRAEVPGKQRFYFPPELLNKWRLWPKTPFFDKLTKTLVEVRRNLIVDTVERMQGQERDLIILSLTTSNPGFAANIADFFFQPERLNVAITRPRSKLIIVGSRFVLNTQTSDPALQETVLILEDG